jgi:hypothetical protein
MTRPLVRRILSPICAAILSITSVSCKSHAPTTAPLTAQQMAESLKAQGQDPQTAQKTADALAKGLSAVDYRPEEIQAATEASNAFYRHLSEGQYASIYEDSSDALRDLISKDSITGFLKMVNDKSGPCGVPALLLTTAGSDNAGRYVEFRYTRNCARVGEVQETLSWYFVSGKPKMRSYFASNPALKKN